MNILYTRIWRAIDSCNPLTSFIDLAKIWFDNICKYLIWGPTSAPQSIVALPRKTNGPFPSLYNNKIAKGIRRLTIMIRDPFFKSYNHSLRLAEVNYRRFYTRRVIRVPEWRPLVLVQAFAWTLRHPYLFYRLSYLSIKSVKMCFTTGSWYLQK